MHDIVYEDVALGAKVEVALRTSIPPHRTHPLAHIRGRRRRERSCARMARRLRPRLRRLNRRIRPDREQVMIAPRQMWRAHDHEPAHIAVRRHVAHLALTPWAQEARAAQLAVAGAQARRRRVRQTRREAHHHEVGGGAGGGGRFAWSGHATTHGTLCRRRHELEEDVAEVALVEGDAELTACLVTELAADLHFGGECDDGDADFLAHAGVEGVVDVAGVACCEGAEDEEDLSGGVGGEVAGRANEHAI